MEERICYRGHVKQLHTYGWNCLQCDQINYQARRARDIASGKIVPTTPKGTTRSVPTTKVCNRGHPRVQRPGGSITCPTCTNAYSKARRDFERKGSCLHVDDGRFEGLVSDAGTLVCLRCLVDEMNVTRGRAAG